MKIELKIELLRPTGESSRSLSRATSEEVVPTELFDTINIFCSVEGGATAVEVAMLLGVGDLELRGVAPVCIMRGILSDRMFHKS